MANLSDMIVPSIMLLIIVFALFKKVDVYSAFVSGVNTGVFSVWSIFPSLFALFIAVGTFRASGLADFLAKALSPVSDFLHFPSDLVPFALLRPVSGSGSLALASDIFSRFGPDSFQGRAVSVMMGSTETTFYTTAVYFAATNTKNIRHTLKCALIADVFSMAVSLLVCYWYY